MPAGWTIEEEWKERVIFRSKRIFYIERVVLIEVPYKQSEQSSLLHPHTHMHPPGVGTSVPAASSCAPAVRVRGNLGESHTQRQRLDTVQRFVVQSSKEN